MRYRIISDSENQLCNRFFAYLDSISWAIRYGKHVYVLFWNENIKYFDVLRNNKYVSFPFYFVEKCKWMKSLYCRIVDGKLANKFYRSRLGRRLGFLSGWPMRGVTDNLLENKADLRRIFVPNEEIRSRVDSLFAEYKKQGTMIVGVHIRRGDYATFMDGAFFYDSEVYKKRMAEIVSICTGNEVVFYLASNAIIPVSLTKPFNTIYIENANTAEDLYALSLCDRLFGPPSTFTRWVSYLNDIPLYFIFDKDEQIKSFDAFVPIKDHYHFIDGRKLPF